MPEKSDLTESELEIMEFIWQNGGATFKEILDYCNDELNKDWKKQTLRSFLLRLERKKYIYIYKNDNKYKYLAIKSKKEHLNKLSKGILTKFFNNSIYDFLSAYSGGEKLNKDSAEELKKFLEEDE